MIRRFEKRDIAQMGDWYRARGIKRMPPESSIPKIGFIVPGVAAGFLYRTDSDVGFLDGVITNPAASSEHRDRALALLLDELQSAAEGAQIRMVIAVTKTESIASRLLSDGFYFTGSHDFFAKEIL